MDPQNAVFYGTGTGVVSRRMAELSHPVPRIVGGCIMINIPGGGITMPLEESYQLYEYAVLTIADELGIEMFTVSGYSQCAELALKFACRRPDRTRRAASLNGVWGGLNDTFRAPGKRISRVARRLSPRPLHPFINGAVQFGEDRVADLMQDRFPGLHSLVFMGDDVQRLRMEIAENWPRSVELLMCGGGQDQLIRPRRSSLDIDVPLGTNIRKVYMGRHRPAELPDDIEYVRAWFGGHLTSLFGLTQIRLLQERYPLQPLAVPSEAA